MTPDRGRGLEKARLIGAEFHQLQELHPSLGPERQHVSEQHQKSALSAESTGLPRMPSKSHTGAWGRLKQQKVTISKPWRLEVRKRSAALGSH